MKKLFWLILLGVNPLAVLGQTHFPDTWQGRWAGELSIYKAGQKVQTLPMSLDIGRLDSVHYRFVTLFGTDPQAGKRSYELIVKDAAKGLYVVDEQNSIQLESYLFENKLFCWFAVEGNLLSATYEKVGERIIFEIVSGSHQPVSTTGGQDVNGEKIPPVQTYPITVVQRAVLKK